MFGIEYNKEYEELMIASMKHFKLLVRKVLGTKTFLLRFSKEEAFNRSTRKYKQVCNTHLALYECVFSIKLPMVLDLDSELDVRVTHKNGKPLKVVMSLCFILMEIEVLSLDKPILVMIAVTGDSEFEGVIPVGRECEGEAIKFATHVASAIMYRLIFDIDGHLDDPGVVMDGYHGQVLGRCRRCTQNSLNFM